LLLFFTQGDKIEGGIPIIGTRGTNAADLIAGARHNKNI
jgi:hypothetical protein